MLHPVPIFYYYSTVSADNTHGQIIFYKTVAFRYLQF